MGLVLFRNWKGFGLEDTGKVQWTVETWKDDSNCRISDQGLPPFGLLAVWRGVHHQPEHCTAYCFKRKIAGKHHLPRTLSSLPPTITSFHVHCQRANYQVALWQAAGEPTPPPLDPLNFGYGVKQSTVCPAFGLASQLPAPHDVLNLVCCSCKTG